LLLCSSHLPPGVYQPLSQQPPPSLSGAITGEPSAAPDVPPPVVLPGALVPLATCDTPDLDGGGADHARSRGRIHLLLARGAGPDPSGADPSLL
jgi:hypothetical protein